jgi:alkylated DNA nucleotide flippase Atl1
MHAGASVRSGLGGESFQQALLQAEAVEFDARGRIDLDRFRWKRESR